MEHSIVEYNIHPEEVMVMKMAKKIDDTKGKLRKIWLVANNPNVRFTNSRFNKSECVEEFTLKNTSIMEYKVKNKVEICCNQRTVFGFFLVVIVGTNVKCSGSTREKQGTILCMLKHGKINHHLLWLCSLPNLSAEIYGSWMYNTSYELLW